MDASVDCSDAGNANPSSAVHPREAESGPGEFAARLAYSWQFREPLLKVLAEVPDLIMTPSRGAGHLRVEVATREQDLHHATDYNAILELPGTTIALRVRRFGMLRRFGGEVALRYPTEARKILTDQRSADFYVYAFADPCDSGFLQWVLLDLRRLRAVWADEDRRRLLNSHLVDFSPGSRGLVFEVGSLQRARVVLRALLVAPAFTSTTQTRALVSQSALYQGWPESVRSEIARLLLMGAFRAEFYVGPDPLGR